MAVQYLLAKRAYICKKHAQSLISEYFLQCQNLYRTKGLDVIHIEILYVSEDSIVICASLHPFFLSCLHVCEGQVLCDFESLSAA